MTLTESAVFHGILYGTIILGAVLANIIIRKRARK
jgi:hypothetical protein|tara:strand:+ start:139 stop:243 length:105 start_codon:yes stop_codon:yes gene_type:complete